MKRGWNEEDNGEGRGGRERVEQSEEEISALSLKGGCWHKAAVACDARRLAYRIMVIRTFFWHLTFQHRNRRGLWLVP